MESLIMFMDWKTQQSEDAILPKFIFAFEAIPT